MDDFGIIHGKIGKWNQYKGCRESGNESDS